MRMISVTSSHAAARPSFARFLTVLHRLFIIDRERRGLRHLDDHLLRDIGLTREQAIEEAARPFWDAPAAWRQ